MSRFTNVIFDLESQRVGLNLESALIIHSDQPAWRRVLVAMIGVQLVIGVSFSIVPPILPLLLPMLGVPTSAAIRIWGGALIGITPLAAALTAPLWGQLTNRIDRRLIVLVSCLGAAVCTTAMTLATNPLQLLALRFAMGLFGGHIAAALSIVSHSAPPERLASSLGWLVSGQLSGSLLGPLLGGTVADLTQNLRAPFYVAGAAALLICAVLWRVPPLPSIDEIAAPLGEKSVKPREPHYWLVPAAVLLLAQCAIMGPQSVVALHVADLVGERRDLATLAGAAFSVVALSGLLAAPFIGRLADSAGPRRALLVVMPIGALCTGLQAFATTYFGFVVARLIAGLFLCSLIPLANTLASAALPRSQHGRVFGITTGAAYLGGCVGPLGCGLLAAACGINSVFLACAGILLATILIVYRSHTSALRYDASGSL